MKATTIRSEAVAWAKAVKPRSSHQNRFASFCVKAPGAEAFVRGVVEVRRAGDSAASLPQLGAEVARRFNQGRPLGFGPQTLGKWIRDNCGYEWGRRA